MNDSEEQGKLKGGSLVNLFERQVPRFDEARE